MGHFHNDEGTLSFWVRSAWLGMRAAIGVDLKELGLSTPQYATLMIVDEHPGQSNADIARKVTSTRQSANEMLAGLERDGLIERLPNPADRRTQQIQITEAGRATLAQARVVVARREAALEAGFTEEQRKIVRTWLQDVATACADLP